MSPLRISHDGGVQARWHPTNGRELFYLTLDGQLAAVPIAFRADGSLQAGTAVPLFHAGVGPLQGIGLHSYIVAADGQRFLIERLMEQTPRPISLIVNWTGRGQ